jgi:hypothetical protein
MLYVLELLQSLVFFIFTPGKSDLDSVLGGTVFTTCKMFIYLHQHE